MSSATAANPARPHATVRKKSYLWLYVTLAVLVLGALVIGSIIRRKHQQQITPVTVEKAVVKTITQLVSATGKIQPEVEVKIAPEVSGEILKLPFREGATVKKGDLLISIKQDAYQAQVEQQEASLSAAKASAVESKAQLLKAEDDFKHSKGLYDKKLISDADFTAAQTALDVAKANDDNAIAQIRRAEGQLNQARDQLSKTIIYSPMDGTISSLTSEVGERVVAQGQFTGTEVMRVANLSNMEARVNINENDIVNVKVGDHAKVTIDAFPGRKFEGEVKEIGSAAKVTGQNTQDEVTNFLVKIRVLDKDGAMRPGMSGNADIETKTVENVVAVPIQSVTVRSRQGSKTIEQLVADRDAKAAEQKGEGAAVAVNAKQQRQREQTDRDNLQRVVFVLEGDHVKMVPVETGISDTSHVEIKSGVAAGDEVVSGSFGAITRTLKDEMHVRVETPKPDKK